MKRWYAQFMAEREVLELRGLAAARPRARRSARRRAQPRRRLRTDRRRGARLLRRAPPHGRPRADRERGAQGDPLAPRLPRPPSGSATCPSIARAPPLRRREPAHPPRQPGRLRADRRDLHPRRALDRAAPARQPAPARDPRAHARHREHVVVVEHDEETIRAADHVIDFGPGAGVAGGRIVHAGRPKSLERSRASLTGAYLSGRREIEVPRERRRTSTGSAQDPGRQREQPERTSTSRSPSAC